MNMIERIKNALAWLGEKTLDLLGLARFRLDGLAYASIGLAIVIAVLAPQQVLLSAYKLSLITGGGLVGYWISRAVFPLPEDRTAIGENTMNGIMLQRAILIAASIVGAALAA